MNTWLLFEKYLATKTKHSHHEDEEWNSKIFVWKYLNNYTLPSISDSTFCLRDLLLSLPPAVSLRDTIGLNCSYHLQGEELYTINLYKGRHEFLQYMPEMVPPLKQFHRKGINIQVRINLMIPSIDYFTSSL